MRNVPPQFHLEIAGGGKGSGKDYAEKTPQAHSVPLRIRDRSRSEPLQRSRNDTPGARGDKRQLEDIGIASCANQDANADGNRENQQHDLLDKSEVKMPDPGLNLAPFCLLAPRSLALAEAFNLAPRSQPCYFVSFF